MTTLLAHTPLVAFCALSATLTCDSLTAATTNPVMPWLLTLKELGTSRVPRLIESRRGVQRSIDTTHARLGSDGHSRLRLSYDASRGRSEYLLRRRTCCVRQPERSRMGPRRHVPGCRQPDGGLIGPVRLLPGLGLWSSDSAADASLGLRVRVNGGLFFR